MKNTKIMDIRLITLALLILASSKINTAPGIYVENQTGRDIYAQIDYGTNPDWKKIATLKKDKNGKYNYKKDSSSFLPSDGDVARGVYFKINVKDLVMFHDNQYYQTQEKYNQPDKITVTLEGVRFYYQTNETLGSKWPKKLLKETTSEQISKTIELPKKQYPKTTTSVIVENDSDQIITIAIETGKELKQVKPRTSELLPSQSGPRELFWTVKVGKGENMYKTNNPKSKPSVSPNKSANKNLGKYDNPYKIIISNYGKSYIMIEKIGKKTIEHDIIDAVNMNAEQKIKLNTDQKTKYATKLSNEENIKLWLLINKKDDANTAARIKNLNLDPNYKPYSNNIIVDVVSNGLVMSIKELLKRGADVNIQNSNGKMLIDIAEDVAKKTKKDIIYILIKERLEEAKENEK